MSDPMERIAAAFERMAGAMESMAKSARTIADYHGVTRSDTDVAHLADAVKVSANEIATAINGIAEHA